MSKSQNKIPIKVNGEKELFPWENIEQFGTLAISLKGNNGVWSIALNENLRFMQIPLNQLTVTSHYIRPVYKTVNRSY